MLIPAMVRTARAIRKRQRRLANTAPIKLHRLRRAIWQSAVVRRIRRNMYQISSFRRLRHAIQTRRARIRAVPIPIDRLMMGGEQGFDGATWAELCGDILRCSTPVRHSPHAKLLADFRERGGAVLELPAFAETAYARNAAQVIRISGSYFGATDLEGVRRRAQCFARWPAGGIPNLDPAETPPGQPIRVRQIAYSDCFQVIDGLHRLAHLLISSATVAMVSIERPTVFTPVQELLLSMTWLSGRRELYQPVSFPEVSTWPVVRRCEDRLALMTPLLEMVPSGATYLDVACGYGWFVSALARRGFSASGLDLDPRAAEIAHLAYGVEPNRILVGDARGVLEASTPFDVVSCFSLLHHFILDGRLEAAVEFLRLLDARTRMVLFVDMGQSHEALLAKRMPGWDAERIQAWLSDHMSFNQVVALGPDRDNVAPYETEYGRTVFACVRKEPKEDVGP
jgi:SAM-dependent methyltransferase